MILSFVCTRGFAPPGRRDGHYQTIGKVHQNMQNRYQPRVQRNQVRDQQYAVAADRKAGQEGNSARLFFCNDVGPVEVPGDFQNDVALAATMAQQNEADVAERGVHYAMLTAHVEDAKADSAVTCAPQGWHAYTAKLKAAEANGPLVFLDREFIGRVQGKVAAFEGRVPAENQRAAGLIGALDAEAQLLSQPRTVKVDLQALDQALAGEAGAEADELARNAAIVATITAEKECRAAKEVQLSQQLAAMRSSVGLNADQLRQGKSAFEAVLRKHDVKTFLDIESAKWITGCV